MLIRHLLLLITVFVFQIPSGFGQSHHEIGKDFLKSHTFKPTSFDNGFEFTRETNSGDQIILESENPPCFVVLQKVRKDIVVVAYSTTNTLSQNDSIQPVARKLLDALENTSNVKNLKTGLSSHTPPLGPLLKTHWGQDSWFNRYCPYEIKSVAGENVYAGCIAVAMAQIIKYYGKWNSFVLDASHNYKNNPLRAYSTGYNWSSMIDKPLSYDLEVCRMLFDLGVLIKMNYGYQNSSQGSGMARIGFNDLGFENAYKEQQHHFNANEWIDMIFESLEEYTPVFVSGGGHAFVCDGYDQDGRLHFNLGWGGYGDGYYNPNSVYSRYSVNEAIFEVIPENIFEPPHSILNKQINNEPHITWSPPNEWGNPEAYRVYYSDEDFFDVQDTVLQIENLRPGTHGLMVSALYPDGESIWIGPVWVHNIGGNIIISDQAINNALSKYNDSEILLGSSNYISQGEMADIGSLTVSDVLESTYPLENMYRLQVLELNASGLTKEDLGFISSLQELQSLKISNCFLEDLPDLGLNTKLVDLKLDSCKAKDLSFLSELEDLVVLELSTCEIENPDIPAELKNLEHLIINNIPFQNTDFISQLSNLRALNLSSCRLTELNLSDPVSKVTCLNLDNNILTNTAFLAWFPNIKSVCAKRNHIERLDIHTNHPYLMTMDFSYNRIDNVSIVFDLPEMNRMNLEHNNFDVFPGIFKHMPMLETLNLGTNQLSELPDMSLPYLQNLNLSSNSLRHISGIDHFEALRLLNLSNNPFSDLSPLIINNSYINIRHLDLREIPVSKESFIEILPHIIEEIDQVLAPPDYEKRSPCFPSPESPARLSNKEILLSWYCENDDQDLRYDILFGVGDSVRPAYMDLEIKEQKIRPSEGQKYHWQIRAYSGDSSFYSGLYEIRTTKELEIPYYEDFELFIPGVNITTASTNWRLSHGGYDAYHDAFVTDIMKRDESSKSLHIKDHTNITIDLDHIELATLIIKFDQFIIPGKSIHTCLKDMSGLQADIYSNGYQSEVYINNSPFAEFEVLPSQWNTFRISIQGNNNRIVMRCNGKTFLNKVWNFSTNKAQIEGITFSKGNLESYAVYNNFESFLDNLLIYDANNHTTVELVDQVTSSLSVYPNPADQYIKISGLPADNHDLTLEIMNTRGQRIREKVIDGYKNEININTSSFEAGIYYYRLIGADSTIKMGKFLIAR